MGLLGYPRPSRRAILMIPSYDLASPSQAGLFRSAAKQPVLHPGFQRRNFRPLQELFGLEELPMKAIVVPVLLAIVIALPLFGIHLVARSYADPVIDDCSYSKPNPGARS